jgi:hypothetical protein
VFGAVLAVGLMALSKTKPDPSQLVDTFPSAIIQHEIMFTRYLGMFRPALSLGSAPNATSFDSFIAMGPDYMAGVQKQGVSEKIKIHDQRLSDADSESQGGKPVTFNPDGDPVIFAKGPGELRVVNGLDDLADPHDPFAISMTTRHLLDNPHGEVYSALLQFPSHMASQDDHTPSFVVVEAVQSNDLNTPCTLRQWAVKPVANLANGAQSYQAIGPATPITQPTKAHPMVVVRDALNNPVLSLWWRPYQNDPRATDVVLPSIAMITPNGEHAMECMTPLDIRGNPRFYLFYSHLKDESQALEPLYSGRSKTVGFLANELYAPKDQWSGKLPIRAYVQSRPILLPQDKL